MKMWKGSERYRKGTSGAKKALGTYEEMRRTAPPLTWDNWIHSLVCPKKIWYLIRAVPWSLARGTLKVHEKWKSTSGPSCGLR